mmetsp:Transcript_4093/g.3426  ORF Transcript_4093/g.3426 Transcript_4093/m.3426 type:complete len:226 (-) Transcript_4093:87-764(-)
MQKYFNRTDWVRGVNQRSSLHNAEGAGSEMQESEIIGPNRFSSESIAPQSENPLQRFGTMNISDKASKPLLRFDTMNISDTASRPSQIQVPMMNGAPLPHDGDPFIRIIKKSKKDLKSRKALVKMLRHEKVQILNARHKIRFPIEKTITRSWSSDLNNLPDQNKNEKQKCNNCNQDMDKSEEMNANISENPELRLYTPESIGRNIKKLLEKLKFLNTEEINSLDE